jgi:predicted GIY-YIG superfamily endonuclease
MFTAYLLACSDGTYHSGVTKNLEARLAYHEQGKNPDAYTFVRRPLTLVFQKSFDDIRTAIAFEAELQNKSVMEIEQIINGDLEIKVADISIVQESLVAHSAIIVPSSYLGNLQYFAEIMAHQEVILDVNERFQKQSYRSRCSIYSANGLQNLIVPVIRPNGKESLMSAILISYAEDWQKDHIKAIESAYRRAPFYEYYAEELFSIIQKKHERLVDLNKELTIYLLNCFGIKATLRFGGMNEGSSIPLKKIMTPKSRIDFKVNAYQQALNTGEFESNLSIIDLLFNVGKEGVQLLKQA